MKIFLSSHKRSSGWALLCGLTLTVGYLLDSRSDNFPTSDTSLGAVPVQSPWPGGAEGQSPKEQHGRRNNDSAGNPGRGNYDRNHGGRLSGLSLASIVAKAPEKSGALRELRQTSRLVVLEGM